MSHFEPFRVLFDEILKYTLSEILFKFYSFAFLLKQDMENADRKWVSILLHQKKGNKMHKLSTHL